MVHPDSVCQESVAVAVSLRSPIVIAHKQQEISRPPEISNMGMVGRTGTAVGIATAFGAPIGGLLFAFEELASSFSQALGWQIFFACMLAVLTLDTFKSAQHALKEGHFGVFDGDASTVFFEVGLPRSALTHSCVGHSGCHACGWPFMLACS
jgi:hypothetical protein